MREIPEFRELAAKDAKIPEATNKLPEIVAKNWDSDL